MGVTQGPLRLLLFDAFHDEYRGVICLVAVVDGSLKAGDKLQAVSTGQEYDALEVTLLCYVVMTVAITYVCMFRTRQIRALRVLHVVCNHDVMLVQNLCYHI